MRVKMTVGAAEFDRVNGDKEDARSLIDALKRHKQSLQLAFDQLGDKG